MEEDGVCPSTVPARMFGLCADMFQSACAESKPSACGEPIQVSPDRDQHHESLVETMLNADVMDTSAQRKLLEKISLGMPELSQKELWRQFFAGSAASQPPPAVWVCQLGSPAWTLPAAVCSLACPAFMFERKLLKGRLPSQKNSRKAFPFVTRRNEAFPKPPPPKSTAFVKIAEPLVKRMDVNWIAVLVHCEDGKDFEIVGNAFKITASVSDVDDLKKPSRRRRS
ncbi:unnamed protein product [Effrenium voratum]|nr:unnamed protein product [Effrenium voratum]